MPITYLKGDATKPQIEGVKFITHIVNTIGAWGNGFVMSISRRWEKPREMYREWHKNRDVNDFALGNVQFVQVEDDTYVANMIAQHDIWRKPEPDAETDPIPPIRYEALRECLKKVCILAQKYNASIHGGRFGAGLAGGSWDIIEQIISEELIDRGIKVFIYDLEVKTPFGRI
jgi:O-acetyl-ADP-ribose deacetylase (regulator of RNase III)